MPETNPKTYQCRHIFADGHRCGSKSLRHEQFCYYHHATRKPAPRPEASPAAATFDLAFPEDRTAIQTSIGEVLRRLATNTIDTRRAGLLLYGLQIASLNLPKTQPGRNPDDDPFDDTVDEVIDHPTLGPLALPAEFVHPDDQRPETIAHQLLREFGQIDEDGNYVDIQATAEAGTTGAPSSARRRSRRDRVGYGRRKSQGGSNRAIDQAFRAKRDRTPSDPLRTSRQIRVPHLRDGFIVAKDGVPPPVPPRRKEAETEGLRFPQIHPLDKPYQVPQARLI
jgi:hypothetical protein